MKAASGARGATVRVSAVHWVLVTSDLIGLTRIGSDKSGIGCAVRGALGTTGYIGSNRINSDKFG